MMGKKAPAPPSYITSSKVCIVTNQWEFRGGNIHTQAVEDRGLCYLFAPTTLELHRYAGTWFWDQEIFDYVAKHLPHMRKLSVRLYTKAFELKKAKDKWKDYVLEHVYQEQDLEFKVLRMLEDGKDWREFVAAGLGSRATFFRYKADLEERKQLTAVDYITLTAKPPQATPDPMMLPSTNGQDSDDGEADE